jgi:ABC-type multidrug transport system ATPase subunit/pSer/pThr/pTyr-binding forkhead associated (FHA) protein
MHFRLVHLTGSLAGRVRELASEDVVLGRDPAAADVVFGPEDRLVSRRHASLRAGEDSVLLRDLESSTGTFVDGEDVEEAELEDGDVFELGPGGPRVRVERSDDRTLLVRASAPSQEQPAPDRRPPPPPLGPRSRLGLSFLSGSRSGKSLELAGAVIRIGRAQGSTVWIPEEREVSAHHAKIVRLEDGYVLLDLESTNGTFLNGHRVERAVLHDADVIELGPGGPRIAVAILAELEQVGDATVVIPDFARLAAADKDARLVSEASFGTQPLIVGRGDDADVRLDSPIVSRRHVRLTRDASGTRAEDLGSANGTFVAGARIQDAPLSVGDLVVVGPFQLEVGEHKLRVLDVRSRARLVAEALSVSRGGRTLLHDVSLTLPPGSFTAIIGASGSGKSTLLSALSGVRPAQAGRVTLSGVDLYASFGVLKTALGYVPQDDIVHGELSVGESLAYTARLRLPADTTAAERAARIAGVLATLELTDWRDVRIDRLSGGQRKRVSIASELLTEPSVLFLDEPTSGLDPGLEEALMLLLRELAYKGKTVVIVTHTLENIQLCDSVALLVEGRLAFHGPPAGARSHFGIDSLVNLYARLKERPAAEWAASRPAAADAPAPAAEALRAPPRAAGGARNALRQLGVLTARYARVLGRDARNLALLLAQAPLVAGLIGLSLLYGASDAAYTKPKNTLLFLLALTSVWFGCSNAVREIVKERAIYMRERMVGLGVLPYVGSKLLVLLALAFVQCTVFLAILHAWFGIPGRLPLLLACISLLSAVGILVGLAVSALVGTPDRAMSLLPIVLIPQVLFTSPAIQMDMKGPAGLVARAMPTWWGFDFLRRIALASDDALPNEEILKRLEAGGPVLMTKKRFESMLQDGYMMFNYRGAIETTWSAAFPEILAARVGLKARSPAAAMDALVLLSFAGGLLTATILSQKRLDRR